MVAPERCPAGLTPGVLVAKLDGNSAFSSAPSTMKNVHGTASYVAYEIVEVDIDTARVIRRTRFADETGGRSTLPYAFDVRVA